MSSSKRASTAPAGPKPPTSISSSAVISDATSIVGTNHVTIGDNTILHPRVKIDSTYATVAIGSFCIISERSVVGLRSADTSDMGASEFREGRISGITVGNGVSIEAGAAVEANSIGDGCIVEVNAKIGRGAIMGKHCKIGPLCEVKAGEVLPDFTVIYGTGQRRTDRSGVEDLRMTTMKRHVEVLRRLIPTNLARWQ
ncbi:MAG: hypothetical protein M1837_002081 [Sclerophora amabilis]|nr:MAG: hypothetical protein M1837_002081 [Sclerophora amabilis]